MGGSGGGSVLIRGGKELFMVVTVVAIWLCTIGLTTIAYRRACNIICVHKRTKTRLGPPRPLGAGRRRRATRANNEIEDPPAPRVGAATLHFTILHYTIL